MSWAQEQLQVSKSEAEALALQALGNRCTAPVECKLELSRKNDRWVILVWFLRQHTDGKRYGRVGGSGHAFVEVFDTKETKVHPGA